MQDTKSATAGARTQDGFSIGQAVIVDGKYAGEIVSGPTYIPGTLKLHYIVKVDCPTTRNQPMWELPADRMEGRAQ